MRRPRVYRAAPMKRHYLFSEQATVYELRFALQEKLKRELVALPAAVLLNRSAQEASEEIIGQYIFLPMRPSTQAKVFVESVLISTAV